MLDIHLANTNRSLTLSQEIAIRVFRTAHELAMTTVAIYSFEDRMSAHRYKVRRAPADNAEISHPNAVVIRSRSLGR